MPPKKNKSGFALYVMEQMDQFKEMGIQVNGFADAVRLCTPGWQALSDDEKGRYSKEKKQSCTTMALGAATFNRARSVDHGQQVSKKARDAKREEVYHKLIASWPPENAVCDVEMVMVDVLMKMEYSGCQLTLPCELAAARFSLRRGLITSVHHFIDSGPIPLGFRYQCDLTSKSSHQLPIEGFELASCDYGFMLNSVLSVVGNASVVFARHADTERVSSGLHWLAEQAGTTWLGVVVDAEHLLVDLYWHVGFPAPSFTSAMDSLNARTWDYEQGARCAYHWELDVRVCALRSVRCLCYCLCDCLCPILGIDATDAHMPRTLTPPPERATCEQAWERKEAPGFVKPLVQPRRLHCPSVASWEFSIPSTSRPESPNEDGCSGWSVLPSGLGRGLNGTGDAAGPAIRPPRSRPLEPGSPSFA